MTFDLISGQTEVGSVYKVDKR